MPQSSRYIVKYYRFGLQLLTLRKKVGLTQQEMSKRIGVNEKTIRNWEGGTSNPSGFHLEKLIETLLFSHAFTKGHELEEAKVLWDHAYEHASPIKVPFDEQWFATLLRQLHDSKNQEHLQKADLQSVSAQPSDPENVAPPNPAISTNEPIAPVTTTFLHRADWSEMPDVAWLYGREHELAELERWMLADRCRVVTLLGMGGIGKTALAARLTQRVAPQFEFVLWHSLLNAPPFEEIVTDYIQAISEHDNSIALPQDTGRRITLLLKLLQERRCLLVLDNVDTILRAGEFVGRYDEHYAEYSMLIRHLAEVKHQSCLLLTSREMPENLQTFVGVQSPVRTLKLLGLGRDASQQLLEDKELVGVQKDWESFIRGYMGNPLALKLASVTVREVFAGNIASFLHEGPIILHTVRQLLDYQFERLSPIERDLMYWLAIERDLVPLEELNGNFIGTLPKREVLAALQSLRWRSLVERGEQGADFILHPVVLEYVTERFVELVCDEISNGTPAQLLSHALVKARSKEYIRDSQMRMLIQPILRRLVTHFGGERELEQQLLSLAQLLRGKPYAAQGYGGGNIVNLLGFLKGEIRGVDFSHLLLREMDLQGIEAQDASFVESHVVNSRFMEPMERIASMALSPNGKYLATGSFSGQIRIWRVPDGQPFLAFRGHNGIIWALAFNPDSTILASGSYDSSVKLWEMGEAGSGQAGRCLRTLQGHDKWVRAVSFSPDGMLLATGGDDETARMWNVRDGTCLNILRGHTGIVWSVAFSSDGRLLSTGGEDQAVRVWDVGNGTCLNTLQRHSSRVLAVAFHPQNDLIVSGGEDGQVNLWDVRSSHCRTALLLHSIAAISNAFNGDGLLIVNDRQDGTAEVWRIEGESGPERLITLENHAIFVSAVAFGPDNLLASVSYSGKVKLWEMESGRCLRTLQGYSSVISALTFNPKGNLLVEGDDNGMVKMWEVGQESSVRFLRTFQAHVGRIWSMAFSPEGKTFVSGGDDPNIRLWDANSGQCLRTFRAHAIFICSMAFNPSGSLLASSSFDRTIKLWRVEGEEGEACLRTLQEHTAPVWSVVFSPDGSMLASGDNDGVIKLWEVESGKCLRTLQNGTNPIGALAFSLDGTVLVSGSNDEGVSIWEVKSGHRMNSEQGKGLVNWIRALVFNRAATMLAAGSNDHTIKLWQPDEAGGGHKLRIFPQREGQVWSVAFSLDGRLLASGNDDGTLVLWDVQKGMPLQVLRRDRPYERMSIYGVKGLTKAQKSSLKALGAIEEA